ncbi:MAG TPA: hypothetical protein VFJ58_14340 [Armatimonadota bacterium]|nr:hypothetical protein [Armatimonadota bacterium]
MAETLVLPYEEAAAVVEDQVLNYLLQQKDPAKTTELISSVDNPGVTPRVIREVLSHSSRFVSINRKWDVAIRHTLGSAPIERVADSILVTFGRPLKLEAIASELALIVGRTVDYYAQTMPRFLNERPHYVRLPDGRWARQDWMLKLAETDEDVLFENFFMSPEEDELDRIRPAAEKFKWNKADLPGSALRFVDTLEHAIPNRLLSYFAWKAAPEGFDPLDFFLRLSERPKGLILSGCRWCPVSLRERFEEVYHELGQREEEPLAPEEAAADVLAPVREEAPLRLDADDLEQVYALIAESDRSWRVPELVESAFDLTEGDRGYEEAVTQLNLMMVEDERFLWVGTDRWREAGSLPEFIFDVPEPLTIPQFIFEDENNEPIDVELEDRGIDDALLQAMSSLLVQDYGDRDVDVEGAGEETDAFEFWVTRRHRESGTLPVLPAFRGLFPLAPDVVELVVSANAGQRFPAWVNDTLETLFGFGQWFVEADLPLSGAMFTLSRTHVPGEYRLDYTGATEPRMVIDEARMDALEMVKLEAEGETPLPTLEILKAVMAPYGTKGAPYARIWTEVNVVRRTTRRMIASLLSAYQCFNAVARGGDVWSYDEKRVPLGINKQKRKYIRETP